MPQIKLIGKAYFYMRNKKTSSPFSLLGWLLGAMSVLNLVDDLSRLNVYGALQLWLDAYAQFVGTVGRALFSWIHLSWISVSEIEYHILVIAVVLCGSCARAQYAYERSLREPWHSSILSALTSFAILMAFPLLAVLLLPGKLGHIGGVVALGLSLTTMLEDSDDYAPRPMIVREITGVLGTFIALIALNYALFTANSV